MKSKKTLWILLLAFIVLMVGAFVLYDHLRSQMDLPQLAAQDNPSPEETSPTENPSGETAATEEKTYSLAPDFTVYDLDGNPVKLSDYQGKPVVLNFWSSRCGPCQMEMPDFEKVYASLGSEVQFLMVNLTDGSWDTVDSAAAFIEESGYTFPVFYDTDLSAAYAYGISSLPTTFFIDAEGKGIAYGRGAMDLQTLMSGIELIHPDSQ